MVPPPFIGSAPATPRTDASIASGRDDAPLPRALITLISALNSRTHAAFAADDPAPLFPAVANAVEALHSAVEFASTSDNSAGNSAPDYRAVASQVVSDELLRLFVKEVARAPLEHRIFFVELLYALREVLEPQRYAYDWWDLLLRPLLHTSEISVATAAKTRSLVVLAMAAAPKESYSDLPRPSGLSRAAPHDNLLDPSEDKESVGFLPPAANPACATSDGTEERLAPVPGPPPLAAHPIIPSRSSSPHRANRPWQQDHDPRAFAQRIVDLFVAEHALDEEPDPDAAMSPADKSDAEEIGKAGRESTWRFNLRDVMLQFGQDSPTPFFHHVAETFLRAEARWCLLELLVRFFKYSPNLIYKITKTPLPQLLLRSLELDTSKTVVTVGVRALTMLIPHIPDWIALGGAGGLPAFLSVLARIVDWRRLAPGWEDRLGQELDSERQILDADYLEMDRIGYRTQLKPGITWEPISMFSLPVLTRWLTFASASKADKVDLAVPNAQPLFTFLYGIFPCNTVRFFREPIAYMEKSGYETVFKATWADVMDQRQLQARIRPILKRHALHPSLITLDAQQEISDTARWSGYDANIVAAKSLRLHLGNTQNVVATAPYTTLFNLPGPSGRDVLEDEASDTLLPPPPLPPYALSAPSTPTSLPDDSCSVAAPSDAGPSVPARKSSVSGMNSLGVIHRDAHSILTQHARLKRSDTSVSESFAPPPVQRSLSVGGGGPAGLGAAAASLAAAAAAETAPSMHETGCIGPVQGAPLKPAMNADLESYGSPDSPGLEGSTSLPGTRASPVVASTMALGMFSHGSTPSVSRSGSLSRRSAGGNARGRRSLGDSLGSSERGLSGDRGVHPLARSVMPSTSLSPSRDRAASSLRAGAGTVANESAGVSQISAEGLPVSRLEKENSLLRNELAYELYLQEQHLTHLGHIHAKRIKHTASEAEQQNLELRVRQLTWQVSALEKDAQRERERIAQVVRDYKLWNLTQTQRQASHSHSERVWKREKAHLTTEVNALRAETARISRRLQQEEADKEQLKGDYELDKPKIDLCDKYAERIRQLTAALAHWDGDVEKYDRQRSEMVGLLSNWSTLARQLATAQHSLAQVQTQRASAEDRAQYFEARAHQLADQVVREQRARHELLAPPPLTSVASDEPVEGTPPSLSWYTASVEQIRATAQAEQERLAQQVYDLTCELDAMRGYEQLVQVYQAQLADANALAADSGATLLCNR